ncbi:MAG: hypothetical protein MJZ86_09110 [Bacteroidales bacterium]|nr:hypothetical protein [Bacteroidales bacterium]
MKKALLFILLSAFALTSFAQKEHLKFQGIPIDGSISSFNQKVASKGWTYDSFLTKNAPMACNVYKGKYFSREATMAAYYTTQTKTVFRVRVIINISTKNTMESVANELKNLLKKKFENSTLETTTSDEDYPLTIIYIPNASGDTLVGAISILEKDYLSDYTLIIDFEDVINSEKDSDEKLSDL